MDKIRDDEAPDARDYRRELNNIASGFIRGKVLCAGVRLALFGVARGCRNNLFRAGADSQAHQP